MEQAQVPVNCPPFAQLYIQLSQHQIVLIEMDLRRCIHSSRTNIGRDISNARKFCLSVDGVLVETSLPVQLQFGTTTRYFLLKVWVAKARPIIRSFH